MAPTAPPPERSASFHGRTAAAAAATMTPPDWHQIRRLRTQPDLPARGRTEAPDPPVRVPAKVLVNVSVQRSLGPLHVMAAADWSVADLVAAAARVYAKEGRRPALPSAEPSAFELHFSQFSLESLDPKEKLMGLGSRNFFLCPKRASASGVTEAEAATGFCAKQAEETTSISNSWVERHGDILITKYHGGKHNHVMLPAAMPIMIATTSAATMTVLGTLPRPNTVDINSNLLPSTISDVAIVTPTLPFPSVTLDLTQNQSASRRHRR